MSVIGIDNSTEYLGAHCQSAALSDEIDSVVYTQIKSEYEAQDQGEESSLSRLGDLHQHYFKQRAPLRGE